MTDKHEVWVGTGGRHNVIIQAPTGVTYRHQCDGMRTTQIAVEGFVVPVCEDCVPVFDGPLDEWPNAPAPKWPVNDPPPYEMVVNAHLYIMIDNEWLRVLPDEERWERAVEAFVPISAGIYRGWLCWENSD